jgi:hypothetical protein
MANFTLCVNGKEAVIWLLKYSKSYLILEHDYNDYNNNAEIFASSIWRGCHE